MSCFALVRAVVLWRSDFLQKAKALVSRQITSHRCNRSQKPHKRCLSLKCFGLSLKCSASRKAEFPQIRFVQFPDPDSGCYSARHLGYLKGQWHFWKLPALNRISQVRCVSTSAPRGAYRSGHLLSSKTSRNSASVTATEVTDVQSPQSNLLKQRYIYVQTSINRWEDVPGGVLFDVAYLDSAPGDKINPAIPLVVSLHTTPGSFYDLQPILQACVKSGCRVLAPEFPGHGHTEGVIQSFNDAFTHSTCEKAEFVRDFLVSLGVKKVDLLIGQGCGCYPVMRLAAGEDTSSMFKSAAFLSPWPHCHFKGTKQKNLLPLLYDMWERPYYRPMAKVLSRFLPNTSNTKSQERITMVYTLQNAGFSEVGGFGVALDVKKFPRVMFFAEDDPFVDAELYYELADMMGISTESIHHFTGQLESGKMEQFPSCLVFEKGGQHIQHTHPGVVTLVLFNLLKSVRPGFQPY